MKTRIGFVSNSSSCSFLVYGIVMDYDEYENISEEDQKKLDDAGISDHGGPEDYGTAVGRSYDGIRDDETGKQFKESIEKTLKEVFGDDIECRTLEESWYN